ncbi:MAG TPA: sialate O-acetylesterase [Saprospiraceae bacterium]|nr:sialate O-acetylesterase [Saprospiraceae bacterium]
MGLSDPNVRVITTADLHPKEDKVHFNSAGQREMGRRFAEAFLGIK